MHVCMYGCMCMHVCHACMYACIYILYIIYYIYYISSIIYFILFNIYIYISYIMYYILYIICYVAAKLDSRRESCRAWGRFFDVRSRLRDLASLCSGSLYIFCHHPRSGFPSGGSWSREGLRNNVVDKTSSAT